MASENNNIVRRTSIVLAVAATTVYLTYRGLFTLNFDGIYASFASLSLFIAEIYGCFLMFLYFFQIWELVEPEPVPPLKDRTVDVYIPTYNEDPDLLRGTISAAAALDYPHKTYVLDDGNRPAVAALAKELGVEYINRPTNLHAKAGNLNHAMEITSGEFVVIFDADHVSRLDFITRLLGYFADERMAFKRLTHSTILITSTARSTMKRSATGKKANCSIT
jgi:cellulose synthase/poly-beta-1,6-N-acetylglucosamine synthase-like glycosyltransferase